MFLSASIILPEVHHADVRLTQMILARDPAFLNETELHYASGSTLTVKEEAADNSLSPEETYASTFWVFFN
jgi:hypothetical protein